MKLKRLGGTNAVEIDKGDRVVLFSYSTPVAVCVNGEGFYRTAEHYSVTTSKHINKWLAGARAKIVPQAEIDRLAGEVSA